MSYLGSARCVGFLPKPYPSYILSNLVLSSYSTTADVASSATSTKPYIFDVDMRIKPRIITSGRSKSVPIPRKPFDSVKAILEKIGRNCASHASKFSSWSDLFKMSSEKMEAAGIPVRERKWILKWLNLYRYYLVTW